jgi:hypothetical protein
MRDAAGGKQRQPETSMRKRRVIASQARRERLIPAVSRDLSSATQGPVPGS